MDIGRSCRVALAQRGHSQAWLVQRTGMDSAHVSRICGGHAHCTVKTIDRLVAAFGMKASEFIALGEDEPRGA